MFDIIFKSDHQKNNFTVLHNNILTLNECRDLRKVSGDIVVKHGTTQTVTDNLWLWDWEKKTDSYAKNQIKKTIAA